MIITVGFEKPFVLTKAIFKAKNSPVDKNEKKSSEGVIIMGVTQKGPLIVRNYFIEISVLFIGAMSGVNGLQEFCFLAAFILLYDCLFLFTFYTAMLTLKLEVKNIYINCFIYVIIIIIFFFYTYILLNIILYNL